MVAHVIVRGGESAFGALFVGQNNTDGRVVRRTAVTTLSIALRVFAGEVVIVVALLIDFRVVGASRERVDPPVFLDEVVFGPPPLPAGQALSSRPTVHGNVTRGCGISRM